VATHSDWRKTAEGVARIAELTTEHVRSWRKLTCERSGGIRVLTHQRQWLCTAALVLMPSLSPIKVLVCADTMLPPELGCGYAAT
jgi:hypothetical protein